MDRKQSPRVFRILLPARDLSISRRFYESLLASKGREVAAGRVYFDCGDVILGILDFSTRAASEFRPPTEAIYLATTDLERVYARAQKLGCLTPGLLHNDPGSPLGAIVVRPWGERSFYAKDPSGNSLCFVDANTTFTGTRQQVAALRRSTASRPRPARTKSHRPKRR